MRIVVPSTPIGVQPMAQLAVPEGLDGYSLAQAAMIITVNIIPTAEVSSCTVVNKSGMTVATFGSTQVLTVNPTPYRLTYSKVSLDLIAGTQIVMIGWDDLVLGEGDVITFVAGQSGDVMGSVLLTLVGPVSLAC